MYSTGLVSQGKEEAHSAHICPNMNMQNLYGVKNFVDDTLDHLDLPGSKPSEDPRIWHQQPYEKALSTNVKSLSDVAK